MLPFSPSQPVVHHNYGTRIRQNSVIKPSARLRQSPDPPPSSFRKSKPTVTLVPDQTRPDLALFPPPNIMLHPEDAHSKVFIAIGRSFLSVNNCAMTIKDLADMTLKFGLGCQNVSAAGQAITSYIRSHLQRCEEQQDHPLLLRHVLSGTPSDDDLLPALHSRSGGAHCASNSENRTTNFRRGTMVWYLSKATGAPCPFARAGVQLCEYGENGRVGSHADARERKKERDRLRRLQKCGQKRKRLPRACIDPDSDSDNQTKPPPLKVKLTLRLRPCLSAVASTSGPAKPSLSVQESDSEDTRDDSISVDSLSDDEDNAIPPEQPWSLPPYPRRSISIPCYTPSSSCQFPFTSSFPSDPYRRSPSVPHSIASPPPNSEDEDDDYHISMTGIRSFSADSRRHRNSANTDIDPDFDLDSEGEADRETQWESPGPRSPSAPLTTADIVVKQEPSDMKGILEAWYDVDFLGDSKIGSSAESTTTTKVKAETPDFWDWQSGYYPPVLGLDESPTVKQEDLDLDSRLSFLDDLASPRDEFDVSSHLPPLPFSIPERRQSEKWSSGGPNNSPQVQWRPLTSMSLPSISYMTIAPSVSSAQRQQLYPARSSAPISDPSPGPEPIVTSFDETPESPNITVSPSSLVKRPSEIAATETSSTNRSNVVVVHTCQPCTPAVSATQIEGISVYQMTLGSLLLLRRIDTDFVNLMTIATHLGLSASHLPSIPNAVVIGKGSATVRGTWVPLASAQAFVREHPLPDENLGIFLSDSLFERFPSALQDFHRSNTPGRLLNQFGPHFKSTAEMQRFSPLSIRTDIPRPLPQSIPLPPTSPTLPAPHAHGIPLRMHEQAYQWDALNDSPIPIVQVLSDVSQVVETPLTATEQEMFHALCDITDWEKENSPPASSTQEPQQFQTHKIIALDELVIDVLSESTTANVNPAAVANTSTDRPLRRSKRVANAMAMAAVARSRPRSCRRSTRNSLS